MGQPFCLFLQCSVDARELGRIGAHRLGRSRKTLRDGPGDQLAYRGSVGRGRGRWAFPRFTVFGWEYVGRLHATLRIQHSAHGFRSVVECVNYATLRVSEKLREPRPKKQFAMSAIANI